MNKVFSRLMKILSKNPAVKRAIEAGKSRIAGWFAKGKANFGRMAKQVQIGGTRLFKRQAAPATTAITVYNPEFAAISARGYKAGKSSFFRRHKKAILASVFGAAGVGGLIAILANRKRDDDDGYDMLDLGELEGTLQAQQKLFSDGRQAISEVSSAYNALLAQAASGADVNQILVAKVAEAAALLLTAADLCSDGAMEYFALQVQALQHGRSLDRDYRLINIRECAEAPGITEAYLAQAVSDIIVSTGNISYRNDI